MDLKGSFLVSSRWRIRRFWVVLMTATTYILPCSTYELPFREAKLSAVVSKLFEVARSKGVSSY
jgi:hypothetical protein